MRYIRQGEVNEILQLHENGALMKDIARKFNISEATVSNYIHGRTRPRFMKRRAGRPRVIPVTKIYAAPDFKEENFSKLKDDVLFQHVRACNFIG